MKESIKEFQSTDIKKERPIILYGAGIYGEYAIKALKQVNAAPDFICDRTKSGREYFGFHLEKPELVEEYPEADILLAVGIPFNEVKTFLMEKGCKHIYSIYDFLFKECDLYKEELSLQGKDIDYYRELYQFGMHYNTSEEEVKLLSLDLVITQRCSLKCVGCSNLMQYYENPQHAQTDPMFTALTRLLSCVDAVMDLRVIGGEPFVNPELAAILNQCVSYKKIRNISIHTNATILPNESTRIVMQNKKIKVELTDYGKLSKNTGKFIDIMKEYSIRHHVLFWDEWQDLGKLENRNCGEEECKKIYQNCYCNHIPTLLDGKLYICPYAAHGRALGAIPYREEDEVDFTDQESLETCLREQVRKLIYHKEYDLACGYCSGRNNQIAVIEPAVQVKEPLPYQKYRKGM